MNAVINNINVNFNISDERVFISSLELSEVFEKQHKHILRAIENLLNDEFKSQNFIKHSYLDKTGRVLPCYNLTRDGFSLLVMGFTGEKAYKWKIEFIKAFNLMEAELKRVSIGRYVDKISALEADFKLNAKHHQNQINGYKGQICYNTS
ncbi:phage antirepressor protein (pRha domain) [Campylobacter mucosalis]|uniref:Rha family transcriptional regulator n=1 Tax=Campylobacter mucosalis TaxID=202 RepID=UPI0006916022|nr:Rha family transcriptional regulator [Campylobacter mucosalis]QKF62946.1 phage antirepressor protein (pRha domain) [Campylobacter mucosalis]